MSVKLYREARRINVRNRRVEEMVQHPDLESESRLSMIQMFIPLGLQAVEDVLQKEVRRQVGGERHDRTGCDNKRWGQNPGSVCLGDQKLRINVPRVRNMRTGKEVPLQSYRRLQDPGHLDELALARVINGISQGKYERAAQKIPETFGIKKSSVSRKFIRASAKRLEEFSNRDLSGYDIVAIFIDGKFFAENEMVIALGVTITGEKVILGFVETSTENSRVGKAFLNGLKERGLNLDQEILFIIDGGKGIHKGICEVMGDSALIARCQWHKRENVLGYLAKERRDEWKRRLQAAYEQTSYEQAKKTLGALKQELKDINISAVGSLEEGMDETLMLQRLGMFEKLGRSFKTTNCIENVNKGLELYTGRVCRWQNSDQRQRWVATALLEIEPRLRVVMGYEHLKELREAMKRFVAARRKQEIAA
ncbi:transposase [Bdellovibrionota bacterium FG-2]